MATAPENLGWLGLYFNSTGGTLGGVIGISNPIDGQTLTRSGNIPGVDVLFGTDNPTGDGTLTFTEAANVVGGDGTYHEFSWAAFGETAANVFAYVDGDDGPFTLESSGGGQLVFDVPNSASLPVVNDTETITVATNLQEVFPNVTKAIAASGEVQYRCIYLYNRCPIGQADRDFGDIRVFLQEDTAASDTIQLGFEKNQTTSTIVDEFTPPAGITFSDYTGYVNAYQTSLEKSVGNSDTLAVWIKRTVPPGAPVGSAVNRIKLRWTVLD